MRKTMTIAAVVATLAVGGWLVSDNVAAHREAGQAIAQRNAALADVKTAESRASALDSQVNALSSRIERCSIMPSIATLLFNANGHSHDALEATLDGPFYLPDADDIRASTRSLTKARRLVEQNQSEDGELWDLCGSTSVPGV